MKLQAILSKRALLSRKEPYRAWQQVYEWEDIISQSMNVKVSHFLDNKLYAILGNLYYHLPLQYFYRVPSFIFEMAQDTRLTPHLNNKNVVPCIIDWYMKSDEELSNFYKKYSRHKIILVTSMQVYKYLTSIETPMSFAHFPLSMSDRYRITPNISFKKDIDVVLMGRQNPILVDWLNQYKQKHPNLIIVSSKREYDNYDFYTQEGVFVANAAGREQCMNLMKRSKVSLYSTKAMDDDYTRFNTNGFNQVTPRLFECMATGNHIIARYNTNEDTEFFELESICPHTDSYESFTQQMDYALSHSVDMEFYSKYLEKHYTSTRVKILEEIMKSL